MATSYNGTVNFSTSPLDSQAFLQSNGTLNNGIGYFAVILKTAGTAHITATDSVTTSITGISNDIAVAVAPVNHFGVVAPPSAITGSVVNFTVRPRMLLTTLFPLTMARSTSAASAAASFAG